METESGGDGPPGDNKKDKEITENSDNSSDAAASVSKHIDFGNLYAVNDKGPYYVYVESTDKNLGRLYPIRVGHYLRINDNYKRAIVDIKIVGRNRVKVILNSRIAANKLIGNELLLKNNLVAYIPKFFTHRKGVIRFVDTFFSEDYLLNNIECDQKVIEVKRMKKKITDSNTGASTLVDRQVIIVSFFGTSLPKYIRINGVIFDVEGYIYPVIQCGKCLKYGHTYNQCRNVKQVCKKCGGNHIASECDKDLPYCIYCNSESHSSVDKNCPVYVKQKRIKQIMSEKNLSFREAESIEKLPTYANVSTSNKYEMLADENFPPLKVRSSNFVVKPVTRPLRSQHNARTENRLNVNNDKLQEQSGRKRGASSPVRSSNKRPVSSTKVVTPNPYRNEFLAYKEKILNSVTDYFIKILNEMLPSFESSGKQIEEFNIKESIKKLIHTSTDDCYENNADSSFVSDDEDSTY